MVSILLECFLSIVALAIAFAKPYSHGQSVGGTSNVTITSGGVERSYLISIPPSYDNETITPVIFSFHGGNGTSSLQLQLSQMSNPEFNDFAFAVYPLGINETWQGVPGDSANDVQFVSDIIDQLEERYSIDPARIWATGKSDGGGFCNVLACDLELSKRIAAFAPVSGAFYVNESGACEPANVSIPCNPGRPKIPMLEFHGLKDGIIEYGGGKRRNACLPTIPHWTQEWALRDGLTAENVTTQLTNDTVVYTFGNGSETGLVTQITDSNLGHDWPSTVLVGDPQTASFNATPIIVSFFKNHPLS